MRDTQQTAWYRQPWPWILMSGPALVVAAGLWTWVLAARTSAMDGLVTDDYYRQGLGINRVLERARHAGELALAAHIAVDGARVRVVLSGAAPASSGLTLVLTSPAHRSEDQALVLAPAGRGAYEGTLNPLAPGVHRLVIEDREGRWRLEGAMRGAPGAFDLAASRAGARP